ncbi:NAD(P)-dependent alcohol dehydrogenase [Nocardiopsis alkaliphila]|uniref:NAD(P)-dependent alcohol dehydrogenase n=1 Tax=Nocardiopsis alkaliphila TaxID=225762 RepID=UPI00034B64C6|nr:NAD(P)-dependent alcohol dehydrogenase [Nocardiopsis alkaliphila]
MTESMRAALYDRYGPPEVIYEGRRPIPERGEGRILVRVLASSVNGGDLSGREGSLGWLGALALGPFPKAVGLDFVGDVVEAEANVYGPAVGDRVWGVLPRAFGSMAEYVSVPVDCLVRVPEGLDPVHAAALPVVTTAITALRDKARLRPGERLLVRGATGGVGVGGVQLGKAYGGHVTALAREENLELARELGADRAFDYRTTSPADLGSFDVVLDTVGTDLPAYRRLLAPGGRMVTISFDLTRPWRSLGYIVGSTVFGPRRVRFFSGNPRRELFEELNALVEAGHLRPVVDRVYSLSEVAGAHRALESGGVRGKIIVDTST